MSEQQSGSYVNTGLLMKNTRKEKETHPDLNGSINIEGVEYWLSAWPKVSKAGSKYLSLAVRKKEEQNRQSSQPTRKAPAAKDELDDLPW